MVDDSKTAAPPAAERPAKPSTKLTFLDFFEKIEEGRIAYDCTQQLENLVRDIKAIAENNPTAKKPRGSISISIDLVGDGNVMEATAAVKLKVPKPPKRSTTYFPTKDNCLSAVHPQQQELEFRDAPNKPVRIL